jgi:hypothetical protein
MMPSVRLKPTAIAKIGRRCHHHRCGRSVIDQRDSAFLGDFSLT